MFYERKRQNLFLSDGRTYIKLKVERQIIVFFLSLSHDTIVWPRIYLVDRGNVCDHDYVPGLSVGPSMVLSIISPEANEKDQAVLYGRVLWTITTKGPTG